MGKGNINTKKATTGSQYTLVLKHFAVLLFIIDLP